jgi:photosystem II stability/assembly factor-like uncharacterized protein
VAAVCAYGLIAGNRPAPSSQVIASAPAASLHRPSPIAFPLAFSRTGTNEHDGDPSFVGQAGGHTVVRLGAAGAVDILSADARLTLMVRGARRIAPEGTEPLPGRIHYLIGNDPARWRTNLPIYQRVGYRNLYDGVDLVFYGGPGTLEYDFIVAPGADPNLPQLSVVEGSRVALAEDGALEIVTSAGQTIRERRPVIYQIAENQRRPVVGGFRVIGDGTVGFDVGAYDATKPLVIDPVIDFSSSFGGSGNDWANGIAVDTAGNTYVASSTGSRDLMVKSGVVQPAMRGALDVYVAKIDPTGRNLVWATYLGGEVGKIQDYGPRESEGTGGIAVDAKGNVAVVGSTTTIDFPVVNAYQATAPSTESPDGFVAKLDSTGSRLVFSTYLGGRDGGTSISTVALDATSNTYVGGRTSARQFPAATRLGPVAANPTAFVARFNQTGGFVYATRFGGGSGEDEARSIAVDPVGQVFVSGTASSRDFPLINPARTTCAIDSPYFCGSGFLAKLAANGAAFVYSTLVGGDARGVGVDGVGNAFVLAESTGRESATPGSAQTQFGGGDGDALLSSFDPRGVLRFATFIGGSGTDMPTSAAVAPDGSVYVAGDTRSIDFPTRDAIVSQHPYGPVFRSDDAGVHWTRSSAGLNNGIYGLTYYPLARDAVYAHSPHDGYYSRDGGSTWTRSDLGRDLFPDVDYIANYSVNLQAALVYSATDRGLYSSRDGLHWALVDRYAVDSVASNPFNSFTILTGSSHLAHGIRLSVDAGLTWATINSFSEAYTPPVIVFDASIPGTVYLGATFSVQSAPFTTVAFTTVFKSVDGGNTWFRAGTGLPSTFSDLGSLAIDPADPRTLYVAGNGVFKSSDGAANWSEIIPIGKQRKQVVVAADSTVYVASPLEAVGAPCLRRSTDKGRTFVDLTSSETNPWACSISAMAIDPSQPRTLLVGTQLPTVPFLAHVSASGTFLSSTYLSDGSRPLVTVDAAGNPHVASRTYDRVTGDANVLLLKIREAAAPVTTTPSSRERNGPATGHAMPRRP